MGHRDEQHDQQQLDETYDVIVVGGGAAGLSAAITLARSLRRVLVIDDGTPRNAPAAGVHNFLSREGTPPRDLVAAGRADLAVYGAQVRDARVAAVEGAAGDFRVALAGGGVLGARRLVVTTGLADELPAVGGLAERWGRDVLHCPFCHGYEVRGQAISVLVGAAGTHQALLFSALSDDVTAIVEEDAAVTAEDLALLEQAGVRIVHGAAASLEVIDDRLTGVVLSEGSVVPSDALVVAPRMIARAELFGAVGLRAVEHPSGLADHVPADAMGQCSVPGIYVAGNVTDPSAQVIGAAAAGTKVGAMVHVDLIHADLGAREPAQSSSTATEAE